MSLIGDAEAVAGFAAFGVRAFTTTREAGTFGFLSSEPTREVMGRWGALRRELGGDSRLATAGQVHGVRLAIHTAGWTGWLRVEEADGHLAIARGTAMAVTVADCVPVFIAHPSGAVGMLHAGWRGTAAGILGVALEALAKRGISISELRVHLGPAICGKCYEVGPDVFQQLARRTAGRPTRVDLRTLLADQARAAGVRQVEKSDRCTRCDNNRFFSHRAGDEGRQLSVIVADQ